MRYIVQYYTDKTCISPAAKSFEANSVEDAIRKADVDIQSIYGVMELDKWIQFNDDRRGFYLDKLPEIQRKKVCWASGFFNKN
jgi:hypothetical protein